MYQNFIAYPLSIILETKSELDKIINEEIENDIRSERQEIGPCLLRPRAAPARIDHNAKQALVKAGPDKQGVE